MERRTEHEERLRWFSGATTRLMRRRHEVFADRAVEMRTPIRHDAVAAVGRVAFAQIAEPNSRVYPADRRQKERECGLDHRVAGW